MLRTTVSASTLEKPASDSPPAKTSKSASDLLIGSQTAAVPGVGNGIQHSAPSGGSTLSQTREIFSSNSSLNSHSAEKMVTKFDQPPVSQNGGRFNQSPPNKLVVSPSPPTKPREIYKSNSSLNSNSAEKPVSKLEQPPVSLIGGGLDHTPPKEPVVTASPDNLDDIQVRKLRDNFQKSETNIRPDSNIRPCIPAVVVADPVVDGVERLNGNRGPDKPARRTREKSVERPIPLEASGKNSNNVSVMSIISRLNALSM